jgi:hypothetical protein
MEITMRTLGGAIVILVMVVNSILDEGVRMRAPRRKN